MSSCHEEQKFSFCVPTEVTLWRIILDAIAIQGVGGTFFPTPVMKPRGGPQNYNPITTTPRKEMFLRCCRQNSNIWILAAGLPRQDHF